MIHYAWIVAFTGALVLLLGQGFGRMSYAVILPSMKDGLLLTYTQVGLIGTANFIGYLCFAIVGGFLAVRFSPRRTIFISLMVMGVSLFLTGLSDSFMFAFLMRLITGMGNGGAVVPVMGLTAAWFAAGKRGLAAGTLTVGTGTGLSIIGLGLPYLIGRFGPVGWRYAWFLLGAFVFVLSFVCYGFLRDTPDEKGTSMYGGEEERKERQDVTFFSTWGDVVREKEIWKLGAVYFMFGVSYIIYMTFFVAYLTSEGGLTPQKAGGIFAVLGLFGIVSGVTWGWISDRLAEDTVSCSRTSPLPWPVLSSHSGGVHPASMPPLSFSGLPCLLYRRLWLQRLEIQWEVSWRLPVLGSSRSFLASANLSAPPSQGG